MPLQNNNHGKLGQLVSIHPVSLRWVVFLLIGAVLAILGIAAWLGLLLVGELPIWVNIVLAIAFCKLPFFYGVFTLKRVFRARKVRILAYSEGFAKESGESSEECLWEEIEAIWEKVTKASYNGLPVGVDRTYTLLKKDGSRIVFDNSLQGIEVLGSFAREQVLKRILPAALKRLAAGATIHFGDWTLSKKGIGNGKETLPWEGIDSVVMDVGSVSVHQKGKWFRWGNKKISDIPNFPIFKALIYSSLYPDKLPKTF